METLQLRMFRQNRVRLVRQTEIAECGLAAVAMVANYHGMDVDLGALRRRFQPSLRGASLKSLIGFADGMGFTTRAVKLPLKRLENLHMPAILHWDMNHYVVLERAQSGKLLIHDPAGRTHWMPLSAVSDHFTGVALEVRPADDFETGRVRERIRLSQLWRRISGLKRALAQTVVLSLVMQAFVLASPYYMQVALDSALPALDHDLLAVLALGFGLFTLVNAGAFLLRSFVLLSAGTSLGFGIACNVARRLFRLPTSWFEKRQIGDILSRFQSISPIRQFLTEGAVAAVLDGLLAALTLVVMVFYSPTLTAVAVTAFAAYAGMRWASYGAQREAQEDAILAGGKEQSTLIETLRGITTLRLYNREAHRHAQWQSKLTDSMNATASLARIATWQDVGNTLVMGFEMIVTVWLAIGFVIDGGFSVGMVFAFIAYKTQFLQKAASLLDQLIAFRILGLHLERLSDIALADQDVSFADAGAASAAFSGRVELKDIGFRYSPSDPLVLNGLNLVVEPGDHIAITGASGGGKSTLVKILLGLDAPDHGEVLVDGLPLARFGYKSYHDQVAAVLQDDHLFAGTLADNIALFDDAPESARIASAARVAALEDDIASMPMGLDTLVGDMGSTLSGGQKQRLLLARAIYRHPRLLVMDEGTSALDPTREQLVNAAIGALGITRIIIAHRLETIVAADRIYALENGALVDVSAEMAPMRERLRQMRLGATSAA